MGSTIKHTSGLPADNEAVQAAYSLGAADLYEAQGQSGALDPAIRQMVSGYKLCGPALTVRCASGDNLTLHHAVAQANPGDIIVADVGDFGDAGHWGEVLAVAAQSRGVAGLVINGGIRDIAALTQRQFPAFARSVSMRAATKRLMGLINEPIVCGGVRIQPGDLLVGDEDGVVAIGRSMLSDVVDRAQKRKATEAELMKRLNKGDLTLDLLDLRR
jgi:4-hydroxy-4-methyl-2-oxoglutarate aldolase